VPELDHDIRKTLNKTAFLHIHHGVRLISFLHIAIGTPFHAMRRNAPMDSLQELYIRYQTFVALPR
jgi:hypothetical protein